MQAICNVADRSQFTMFHSLLPIGRAGRKNDVVSFCAIDSSTKLRRVSIGTHSETKDPSCLKLMEDGLYSKYEQSTLSKGDQIESLTSESGFYTSSVPWLPVQAKTVILEIEMLLRWINPISRGRA